MKDKRLRSAAKMFIVSMVTIIAAFLFIRSQAAQTTVQTDGPTQSVLIEKNRIIGSPFPELISTPPSTTPSDVTTSTLPPSFDSAMRSFERGAIRDTAFSAEVEAEMVMPLREGGTKLRKTTYLIYRDSQGRTRRDLTSDNANAAATDSRPRNSVINDPVASSRYLLDHRYSTVRKLPLLTDNDTESQPTVVQPKIRGTAPGFVSLGTPSSQVTKTALPGERRTSPRIEKEQLGQREIGGVIAEGTRYVRTTAIGASDNEKPIQITTEEWFSVDLQAIVAITISDPRYGRSEYRLVNIVRGEPSPTLFAIPQNYKLKVE